MAAISTATGFICAALASSTAVLFTNPAEVIKTRLQLSNELSRSSSLAYTSLSHAVRSTWSHEGVAGFQRGLGAAVSYQVMMNGTRLGTYEPVRVALSNLFLTPAPAGASSQFTNSSSAIAAVNISSGAMCGAAGAAIANPLYLIKARMQAFNPAFPVGAQHAYASVWQAVRSIASSQGIIGLFRGVDAAMLRTAMGSSVQMPTYNLAKSYISPYMSDSNPLFYLAASTISGLCVCTVMQPADTALTRVYNQPRMPDGSGKLYKGPLDCLAKTVKTEGFLALYKGSVAHLARIAPHTVLCLVLNDFVVQSWVKHRPKSVLI